MHITNETTRKYEPRTRPGFLPFIKNVVRGQFQKRPSETVSEAKDMLEMREDLNEKYRKRNLDTLQAQAKAEAEQDGKTINLDQQPPKAA